MGILKRLNIFNVQKIFCTTFMQEYFGIYCHALIKEEIIKTVDLFIVYVDKIESCKFMKNFKNYGPEDEEDDWLEELDFYDLMDED